MVSGDRLGLYEILGKLGEGGMGEVYRARDTRLGREVAVKILPRAFTTEPDRIARFEREARVLASLNHPHIATIHGIEDSDGVRALVMELVEGTTVADRLTSGAMPIKEALVVARQIAEALDAAHGKGIVHRDLKPSNIKITPTGLVKVLDFGLAKAVLNDGAWTDLSQAQTTAAEATREGVIVGTVSYMSPEQARGQDVDRRTDIWAFGCVLYEMLAGRPVFDGSGATDTLSRVLQLEPDFTPLPKETPTAIRRLLVRCLEKDRNKRIPQMAVAAFQIDEVLTAAAPDAVEAFVPRSQRARQLVPAVVAGAVVGAATLWIISPRQPAATVPVTRLQMTVSPADEIGGTDGRPTRTAFAISPDGRTLVFSAVQKTRRALYARPLDRPVATLMPGTEGAVNPFFSPDGRWVGYWAEGQIRKVPLGGGPPVAVQALSKSVQPQELAPIFGASWGDDDRIVFAQSAGGLQEVPSAGGNVVELTATNSERREFSHRLPHVLPGSDAVLLTVTHNRFPQWDETQIWVYSRGSGTSKLLIDGGADARYVSSGHLLYVREGTLLAAPFDLKRLELTGGPVGVTDVMQAAYVANQPGDSGAMQASVSRTGTLVYIAGGMPAAQELSVMEVDRTGRAQELPIEAKSYRTLRLSPDGTRLALSSFGRDRSIWLYSFARGTLSRLASVGRSIAPVWTPDGEQITYASTANGPDNLYSIRADGAGSPELVVASPSNLVPGVWTPDAHHLLYYVTPGGATPGQQWPTIWAKSVTDTSPPRMLAGALGNSGGADVSPDGRWVAYHSAESGPFHVFVEAFPNPGPRYQVSIDGGGSPIWRRDGRELFYLASNDNQAVRSEGVVRMMAVAVTTGPTLTFGTPRPLFVERFGINSPARGYDVSSDGQRFWLLKPRERTPDVITTINVVQNWARELK
jgi:serine/threonine-protein kinase